MPHYHESDSTRPETISERLVAELVDEQGLTPSEALELVDSYEWAFGLSPWASNEITADSIVSRYRGRYDSETQFAWQEIEDTDLQRDWPPVAIQYFDIDYYARDLFLDGYRMDDSGHVWAEV